MLSANNDTASTLLAMVMAGFSRYTVTGAAALPPWHSDKPAQAVFFP